MIRILRIFIFDLVGKLIREISVNGRGNFQIDISGLGDGVYYLKSNANLGVKRIVKIGK